MVREDPNLIAGFENGEGAGVYRISADLALIQTVDFFTPVVDDPYTFGQVAAANALSDVYAMGGRPLTCLNVVGFPVKRMGIEVLQKILEGGLSKIHEAGAVLVGGHSVDDEELKYGLSVTGLVHPDDVATNAGAKAEDRELGSLEVEGSGTLSSRGRKLKSQEILPRAKPIWAQQSSSGV